MENNLWVLSQKTYSGEAFLEKAGLSRSTLSILHNRGYSSRDSVLEFLKPSLLDLHSPFLFKDMEVILQRLAGARADQEKILIYGDYDADGVTGTALLYKGLTSLGYQVVVHIPSREEGYGLHSEAIEKASHNNVSLMITVDCGISAVQETAFAKTLDIDMIITDHHEPPDELPCAVGILNPKIADSGYPFPHLAGVGVAFKLLQALYARLGYSEAAFGTENDYLDLVALGTIADIVPLVGENRILVKNGLTVMENTRHSGIRAMLEECGLLGKKLKAGQISFIVAPRINAAGRMDTARLALNLLLEETYDDALEMARELSKENNQRQLTEKELLCDAERILAEDPIPNVIVLSSPNWHHGVIGIVASRLVERYKRPVFLIAEEGDTGKGSARGISDYHVLDELKKQADTLSKFGGHKQAAGFTLPVDQIPQLREGLNNSFLELGIIFKERFQIDSIISWDELNLQLLEELEQMAPFGAGNPAPVLRTDGLVVQNVSVVGKGREHLKMTLAAAKLKREAMAFKKGQEFDLVKNIDMIDIIYNLELNSYGNVETIQAVIKDFRPSGVKAEQEIACTSEGYSETELAFSGNLKDFKTAAPEEKIPAPRLSRKILADFYRNLKSVMDERGFIWWEPSAEKPEMQLNIMKIFEELGIISWYGGTGPYLFKLNNIEKTYLQTSLRFRVWSE
ncbi:MAG: single-stranded-DNA-specific exonuclease RecJ [Dehalobacter sp. 4CP]|uniref:single-stranded-DNA-specific exonuclease RecJ n=1 Tax=Dehalobacter sp. CP TaxID=2594474 RepID=UPI0013CC421A|nr:single-stranded-DNA-specific exonuclease RecJ [Dehalobacter sp. 4CP]